MHREGRLTVAIQDYRFRATETAVISQAGKRGNPQAGTRARARKAPLPRLEKNEPVLCTDPQTNERKTQPPQHFTDATAIGMTNTARFVADNELETLRETDGLGTEATRAAIIDTLFRRDYLVREKRFIRATDKGKS